MQFQGLVTYLGYFLSFWNEIINYLFLPVAAPNVGIWFARETATGTISASSGQWALQGNYLPGLTNKGADILAAIMTIAHNGLVAVAQLSTLLPANAL